MTTADRVNPGHRIWAPRTPSAVDTDRAYAGRHRRSGQRGLNLVRMFYLGKHRRR